MLPVTWKNSQLIDKSIRFLQRRRINLEAREGNYKWSHEKEAKVFWFFCFILFFVCLVGWLVGFASNVDRPTESSGQMLWKLVISMTLGSGYLKQLLGRQFSYLEVSHWKEIITPMFCIFSLTMRGISLSHSDKSGHATQVSIHPQGTWDFWRHWCYFTKEQSLCSFIFLVCFPGIF